MSVVSGKKVWRETTHHCCQWTLLSSTRRGKRGLRNRSSYLTWGVCSFVAWGFWVNLPSPHASTHPHSQCRRKALGHTPAEAQPQTAKPNMNQTSDKAIKSTGCGPHAPGEIGSLYSSYRCSQPHPLTLDSYQKGGSWELAMTPERAQ